MKLKNLKFIAILLFFVAAFAVQGNAQSKAKYTPDAAMLKEMQKTVTVGFLSEDWTNLNEEQGVYSPNKSLTAYVAAFAIGDDSENVRDVVVVLDHKTDKYFEIRGLDAPRPIENLKWQSNDVLVFDQWMNPRRGARYAVNVRTKKLVAFGFLD